MTNFYYKVGIILLLLPTQLIPCTIFKLSQNNTTLIGNNEDWSESDSKVWFLTSGYRRILLGFSNGWVQGGMNDQGLFFDGIAGPVKKWSREPGREDYPGNLCEMILREAADVKEVIPYFEQYNFPSLITGIFIFVDKSGETAVFQYEDGRLSVNLHDSPIFAIGYRGERAGELLREMTALSVKGMQQITGACLRTDMVPTQYANIYDPQNLVVHVSLPHGFDASRSFNLPEEWAKGDHYYDLPKAVQQLNGSLLTDHKTAPSMDMTAGTFDEYAGTFQSGSSKMEIYRSGSNLFFKSRLIFDGVMAFRMVPLSEERFVARDLNLEIRFRKNKKGEITGLETIHGSNKHSAERMGK